MSGQTLSRSTKYQRRRCPAPKASKLGTNVKSVRFLSIFTSKYEVQNQALRKSDA